MSSSRSGSRRQPRARSSADVYRFGALDVRGHAVHAEGWRALQNRIRSGAQIDAREHVDGLVASAPDQEPLGRHAVQGRKARDEGLRLRLGIAVEAAGRRIPRGAPRGFVRMQPRERRQPGGMRVGLQIDDLGPREREHGIHGARSSRAARRMRTEAACASSPSSLAKVHATSPIPASPAGESSCTVMRF